MMGCISKANVVSVLLTLALLTIVGGANAQRLILSDAEHKGRLPEVVEIPVRELKIHIGSLTHFKVVDSVTHKELTSQIYSDPNDSTDELLLIALQIPESGSLAIDFEPMDDLHIQKPLVFGREAIERKDDFAWENEYVTYRVYGPALEATGEITSGIDVWSKRVPNFVIDRFYKRDAEGARTHNPALSYHKDDGIGLDSYLVGATRGCGGTGVLSGGKLWLSNNYTHLKLISSGPVRFEFELTYAPWKADGVQVTETKHISLDAGSHLNKITSTFTFTGQDTIDAAAGLAVHSGANLEQLWDGHVLSVWDTPQDPTADRIATGMIALPAQGSTVKRLDPNGLLVFPVHSGQSFTYYAGSGWSKADMPTWQTWDAYLTETLRQLQSPLKLQWQENPRNRQRGKR
jgi:hypothetical protein